jgi:hypothetical protein
VKNTDRNEERNIFLFPTELVLTVTGDFGGGKANGSVI